jgi:hypothetical protein
MPKKEGFDIFTPYIEFIFSWMKYALEFGDFAGV